MSQNPRDLDNNLRIHNSFMADLALVRKRRRIAMFSTQTLSDFVIHSNSTVGITVKKVVWLTDLSVGEMEQWLQLFQVFKFTDQVPLVYSADLMHEDSIAHVGVVFGVHQSRSRCAGRTLFSTYTIDDNLAAFQWRSAVNMAKRLAVSGLYKVNEVVDKPRDRVVKRGPILYGCPLHKSLFEPQNKKFLHRTARCWDCGTLEEGDVLPLHIRGVQMGGLVGMVGHVLGNQPMDRAFYFPSNRQSRPCYCHGAGAQDYDSRLYGVQNGKLDYFDLNSSPVWRKHAVEVINRFGEVKSDTEELRACTRTKFGNICNQMKAVDPQGVVVGEPQLDPLGVVGGSDLVCTHRRGYEAFHQLVLSMLQPSEHYCLDDVVLDGCDFCGAAGNTRLCYGREACVNCAVEQCSCKGRSCKKCRNMSNCETCGCLLTRHAGVVEKRGAKMKVIWTKSCPRCDLKLADRVLGMIERGYTVGVWPSITRIGHVIQIRRRRGLKQGSIVPNDPKEKPPVMYMRGASGPIRVLSTEDIPKEESQTAGGASLIGVGFSAMVPTVAQNSVTEIAHSLVTRQLKPQPSHDVQLINDLEKFVDALIEEGVFGPPVVGPCDPSEKTKFTDWVGRFPPGRRAQLWAALQEVRTGFGADGAWRLAVEREIFGKQEKLEKGASIHGSLDWCTRIISSLRGYHASCVLGPHIHKFGERLKSLFHAKSKIVFASGMDAVKLGGVFHDVSKFRKRYHADHSKFDSTLHKRLLELEAKVYAHWGLKRWRRAWWIFKKQLLSKFRVRVVEEGQFKRVIWGKYDARRNSGDANTSVGNSIINAICATFAIYVSGLGVGWNNVREFLNADTWKVCVVGDDLLMGLTDLDEQKFLNVHKRLGLVLEMDGSGTISRLCFAGCRSVSAIVDGVDSRLAIPQFERWGAKIGWTTIPMPDNASHLRNLRCCWEPILGKLPLFGTILSKYPSGGRSLHNHEEGWTGLQLNQKYSIEFSPDVAYEMAEGLCVSLPLLRLLDDTISSIESDQLPIIVGGPMVDLIFGS